MVRGFKPHCFRRHEREDLRINNVTSCDDVTLKGGIKNEKNIV